MTDPTDHPILASAAVGVGNKRKDINILIASLKDMFFLRLQKYKLSTVFTYCLLCVQVVSFNILGRGRVALIVTVANNAIPVQRYTVTF